MNVEQAAAAGSVVSKSEFARRRNVTPGRVTQWISERKIFGDAIVGEGRSAQICEPVAVEQLRRTLDIDQRLGANGLSTRLAPVVPPETTERLEPQPHGGALLRREAPPPDPIEEGIKRARLEGIERDNRRKAEEEAARAGRYVPADELLRQVGQVGTQMLAVFEGALADFATAISAKFGVPQRDVVHLLRSRFRDVRAAEAAKLGAQASALPQLVDDEPAPAMEEAGAD